MATGAEFLAYVKRKFKREDKDTEIYEATTDIIADMRLQFLSEDYKEEAYSTGITTIGEYRLGLPSDFGHIIGEITVVDTTADDEYPPLKKISKQRYDQLYGDRLLASASNMDTDVPRHFCIFGNQIFLGPVPDSTAYKYQFNYTTEAYTEVSASTDPVPFTDNYRNILRCGVLAELYDGLENYQESQYWRDQYLSGLNKIVDNDSYNIADTENIIYSGF